jgi:hypothetical protein
MKRWRIGRWIPFLVIALVFLTAFSPGRGVLMPCMLIAALWIFVVWRREIRLHPLLLGVAVTIIAFLGGLPFWANQFVGKTTFVGLLVFVTPMFVAGGLLFRRTGVGGSQLYAGRYREAFRSFLWGCLLFIPLGLLNAAAGSPGRGIAWVTHW